MSGFDLEFWVVEAEINGFVAGVDDRGSVITLRSLDEGGVVSRG